MIKHFYIKIEGDLDKTDFNYYCQIGAHKFNINAIYVNGNSRDVELNAEGSSDNLNSYVEYLQFGPLKPFIETFDVSEQEVRNLTGFISRRVHKDEKVSLFTKLINARKKK
jgi:acylphosphatase